MKKNIVLFIFLLLSAIGLEYETQAYTTGSMSGTSYGIVGLSALLALLYIVPALLLIRQLGKKWQTPALSLGVALLGGHFRLDLWLGQHLYPRMGQHQLPKHFAQRPRKCHRSSAG